MVNTLMLAVENFHEDKACSAIKMVNASYLLTSRFREIFYTGSDVPAN